MCQTCGNALISTSIIIATKHAFGEPLSSNGLFRHIASSLRLFIPNSLLVYHRSFFSEGSARYVFLWLSFSCGLLLSNCSHCSLLKNARPKQFPDKVPVNPGASPSSKVFSFQRWGGESIPSVRCSRISGSYSMRNLFFHFRSTMSNP
jgi:hypothetical protein